MNRSNALNHRPEGGDKIMVKLYKIVKGEMKLMDRGIEAQAESYIKQGYIVVPGNINNKTWRDLNVTEQIKDALRK